MSLNRESEQLQVLMVGPGLKVTGGVSAVVNNWLAAGLNNKVHLKYIATLTESRPGLYPGKFADALKAIILFSIEAVKPYDLVHIHLSYGASFFRKLAFFVIAKAFRKKVLIHLHGSKFQEFYFNSSGILRKLISYMFNNADTVLVLSKQWQRFVETISINPEIHILFNGSFPREKNKKKANNISVITFMGRLGERKGTYDLIDAFDVLHQENKETTLLLCGDGDIDKVNTLLTTRQLGDAIKVLGWVSGAAKETIFLQSDVFILPSYNEGLPGAILEAMSYGLPIISTHVGGIPEAVQDGINGMLIEPGDIAAMAESLKYLSENVEKRHEMGLASLSLIKNKFNIYNIVDELVQHYLSLAERTR